jgi:hypothetical protein
MEAAMARAALFHAVIAVLVGAGIPALACAQSSNAPKPRPATVVRSGGTRAGMAPPPPPDRDDARSRTTERRGGFEQRFGVIVGSFARPIDGDARRRRCANFSSTPAAATLVQPHASQPVVTQPGYASIAPESAIASDNRVCDDRRAP